MNSSNIRPIGKITKYWHEVYEWTSGYLYWETIWHNWNFM